MEKIENFILHIPLIGLLLMLTIMGSRTRIEKEVTFEEVKTPLVIQLVSVILAITIALIFN